jgi:SAM-dependent methyltransferase
VSRWSDATGGVTGRDYAARFDELAATGADVHGEASLCAALVPAGARVLDAGCGTGRVGIRLAELGYDVTGVDLDESMLAVARERAPQLRWLIGDLATVDLGEAFDLVLMAGNIVPLVADGSESTVVARMAAHVATGGLLVAGFGLDRAHLPPAAATVRIADYDAWCASAGLTPAHRFSTWNGTAYTEGSGYAVSVHAQPVSGAG